MSKRKQRVREAAPVQVYLDREGQDRLERLTSQLDATRSEVLRRGLEALEQSLIDPAAHPALRVIGLAEREATPGRVDPAREHDRLLADAEERSWSRRGR
jgi:Arc/MetJ-type ribon-helix-helix transcriptional regulator